MTVKELIWCLTDLDPEIKIRLGTTSDGCDTKIEFATGVRYDSEPEPRVIIFTHEFDVNDPFEKG
jgi:hypothetical protein